MEWLDRMKNALELIESKLEETIEMEEIAQAAYSSSFHFQRMFHMLTGMTVAEYVRKRRLTLAAYELAASASKVLDISLKYGYDSPEAFARAFRKLHGISPSAAREPGATLKACPRLSFHLSLKGDKEMDYRIVEKDAFRIFGKSLKVSCKDLENHRRIPLFWKECNEDGTTGELEALQPGKELLGVCADFCHKEETLTYWIAVEGELPDGESGFESRVIPAASWAVFTSIGPMPTAIQEVWGRIYQEWFPSTGYQHAGGPELEVYLAGEADAADYKCEIWIPVKK
ncbi:MAG: AraC family transcriptional regulator [Paenibacillaceae bacterium]|nr:AraC family transcriptional regulator [Paenibacillaceae bacterium]